MDANSAVSIASANGTFRTWRDVRLESVMRTKADVSYLRAIAGCINGDLRSAWPEVWDVKAAAHP
jgi:hypothetical protein